MKSTPPKSPETVSPATVEAFIARWSGGDGGQERANYALFLSELCDAIGAPRPDQASHEASLNAYAFERAVTFREPDGSKSAGRIDLYKRGCFVLEAKQSRRPARPRRRPDKATFWRRRKSTPRHAASEPRQGAGTCS